MCNYIKEIDNILLTNKELFYDFGKFSRLYLTTTENIKDFLIQFDLFDKDVLTVAGSGDQMLNAYLMGAKNVTCFDINPLAYYQINLKKAAVCGLKIHEFIDFFFAQNDSFLDYSLFDKFSSYLDDKSLVFWDYIYSKYGNKYFDSIYYRFNPDLDNMKRMNAYLEEENYEKLAYILKNKDISFIESNVSTLSNNLDNNYYDLILLSNISESIHNIWDRNYLEQFKNVIYSLANFLNQYGYIQVGYIYDYYNQINCNLFGIKSERQKVFTTDIFHTSFVDSFIHKDNKDGIITYQKII